MKTRFSRIAIFSIAAGCIFIASPAGATTATNTLTVSATVIPKCTIGAATLPFGNYDPVVANASAALAQSATITFLCTLGAAGTIDIDKGANSTGTTPNFQRRMGDGAAHFISYNLYQDSAHTLSWGALTGGTAEAYAGTGTAGQTTTLYGTVAAGQNVTTGAYSDTATMTITF